MSWLGLRHKGVEILFPDEWNAVVDGLDILKAYADASVKYADLQALPSDVAPDTDNTRLLGYQDRAWRSVYAHYGYFLDDAYVQGRRVLKDGDPVVTRQFIEEAKADVEKIYTVLVDAKAEIAAVDAKVTEIRDRVREIYDVMFTARRLRTWRLVVGTTPVPLSQLDMLARRLHVKLPSWASYLAYIGDSQTQDFIIEPGDEEVLELVNPRTVYVRSLGEVEVFVAVEE